MKRLFAIICPLLAALALPAWEHATLAAPGGEASFGEPRRLAAARALSTVASGTVTLKAWRSADVYTNATVSWEESAVLWRRVLTNSTQAVTNDYPGQVAYTPPPPWRLAGEGWVTNTATRTATRRVRAGTVCATNTIATLTCAGGLGTLSLSTNVWIAPGDTVTATGTAAGEVTLILEE